MSIPSQLNVELFRDGNLESNHIVNFYNSKSNSNDYFFPRSSVKPFQIIPLLYTLSIQNEINLTDEEIALFASSHSGEKLHTDLLLITSEKYNLNLDYLICGAQRPFHDKTADSILNDNNDFLNIHNNCSGKHLSMLLFSKVLNVDFQNYYNLNHKSQANINEFFYEIFQTKDISYGIDGCGLPAIRLKTSDFIGSINFIKNSKYSEFWNRVFNAYVRFPEIIGGTNRPDSNLIKNSNSPLLAKSGAEGVMFVTNNNDSFLFKCLDGSKRGVDLASSHYLQSIGLVSNSPFESQVELYSRNRQNNKAVEIKITKNF